MNQTTVISSDKLCDKLCLDMGGFMAILARSGFSPGRKPN